jgi:hypothetical protein
VIIPVRIAFEEKISIAWKTTDYAIDFVFFVDIIVNFVTALEDDSGDYVINRKVIAK